MFSFHFGRLIHAPQKKTKLESLYICEYISPNTWSAVRCFIHSAHLPPWNKILKINRNKAEPDDGQIHQFRQFRPAPPFVLLNERLVKGPSSVGFIHSFLRPISLIKEIFWQATQPSRSPPSVPFNADGMPPVANRLAKYRPTFSVGPLTDRWPVGGVAAGTFALFCFVPEIPLFSMARPVPKVDKWRRWSVADIFPQHRSQERPVSVGFSFLPSKEKNVLQPPPAPLFQQFYLFFIFLLQSSPFFPDNSIRCGWLIDCSHWEMRHGKNRSFPKWLNKLPPPLPPPSAPIPAGTPTPPFSIFYQWNAITALHFSQK